jgi:hypothetical protein
MKPNDDLLKRMLRAARVPRVETTEAAPLGFATRVAARWAQSPREAALLPVWERLCGRAAAGMAVAALVVGLTVWHSWLPVQPDEEAALAAQLTELVFVP